ncbi:sugar transferase [Marinilabiliaceae bacterium ANBcel2]|nr:sugar transferase [Marinilabiliaceae bacterium ANBcel2]
MLKERARLINSIITIADVFIAIFVFNIVINILVEQPNIINHKDNIIIQLLIIIYWALLSDGLGTNVLYRSRPSSLVLFNCTGLVIMGTTLLILSAWLLNISHLNFRFFALFSLTTLFLTATFKLSTYRILKKFRKKGRNSLNLIVIADKSANHFLRQIKKHPEWGYKITAILGKEEELSDFKNSFTIINPETDIEQLLRDKPIDEVVVCSENMVSTRKLEEVMQICNNVGVVFRMYSPFFNMLANKTHLHFFGTTPLVTISNTPMDYLALKGKHLIDRLFSAAVIILGSPIFLTIAAAIKIDSKGPVFFKQERCGLRGRRFFVYKFRTMVVNAEELKEKLMEQNEMDGPVFKISRDPRITKMGHFLRKTSLDELPQFFNVLKGEMSVVGPRPPIPAEVKEYELWQLRRLSMKPGITCIWQVSGRNNIPFEEWMKMDLEYIDNWSLKLDFILFLKTIRTMFRGDGK